MSSNTEQLKDVINQAIDEVCNDFKLINGGQYGGWHQFFKSQKVGNVATSQALLLLEKFSVDFQEKNKAIEFLLANQVKSVSLSNNGGWAFISNVPDIANTESTSWSLQALSNVLEFPNQAIQEGLKWLKLNFINGPEFSGWGPTKESGFRIYTTCTVLNTGKKLNVIDQIEFNSAFSSLKRSQNVDGGWGEVPRSQSTLTHTAHATITLLNLGVKATSHTIQTALKWIIMTLEAKTFENEHQMGYSEMFDFKYSFNQETKLQRITYYHLPLPYAILALIKGGKESAIINEAVMALLHSNEYGIWKHPFLSEKPLWGVYDVLQLLQEFSNSAYIESFRNFTPKNKTKNKFDVIIFTVVPTEFHTLNKILSFAPTGKKEDFSKKGFWYYEYLLKRPGGKPLSCLITMIGSAGDISCYSACSTTFEEFDCDLAILCGIAAGNKEDIRKYSAVIAESIVAYEYQRLEEDKITHRPQFFQLEGYTKRVIEKVEFHKDEWKKLVQECISKSGVELEEVKNYKVEETQLKIGVIAAGAKLIADGKTLEVLKENIPIAKGIIAAEMEGSGFAPCCKEYNKEWLVIRGISDYGEDDKNDPSNKKQQPLAVATAAATMIYYLNYLHRSIDER